MVLKESLNNDLIVAGKALIEKLLESGEAVPPAIWKYLDEPNSWRLIIGVPIVKTKGPRDGYKLIQKMFNLYKEQFRYLSIYDITVVAPDDRVLAPFQKSFVLTDPNGTRVSHTMLNGQYIDDAYVYNLD